MQLKRRQLIAGSVASAAGALIAASAKADPLPMANEAKSTSEWDVVVVGAGFAGMCAALEAAELGAKVVLLEKRPRPDGTTVYSSGWIAGVGSQFQKDVHGDSEQAFFDDMMKLSGYRSDPALIRVYAQEAGPGIDWLAKQGVPLKLWPNLPAPELSRCVIAQGSGITGGAMLIKTLLERLEEKNVPVHYNVKAVELMADPVLNVEGVSCITPEGRVNYKAKGGVILTTGGFGGNTAMLTMYMGPWANNLLLRATPWNTGENIIMANQVLAKLVNMDQFYAGPITPTGHANPSPLMHAGYGIQVNSQGKRFVPETWLQVPKAKAIAQLTPDNRSYILIGQDADASDNILSNTIERFKRVGYEIFKGNTIAEVAKAAGLPVKSLEDTVKEFNAAVLAGKAKELTPPYEYDTPHALTTGPYYLLPAAGGIANTFGGPKINADANVVNLEGDPILGLYAAGAAAGGIWYQDDIGGNQLGGCMVFGRVAARHAFKRAQTRA